MNKRTDDGGLRQRVEAKRSLGSANTQEKPDALSERRRGDASLQQSEAFNLAILDSISAEVAVLDRDGVIVVTNKPWQRFTWENGSKNEGANLHIPHTPNFPQTKVGDNFLTACQVLNACLPEGVLRIEESIMAVSKGSLPGFSFDYPRHSAQAQGWCSMRVTPLGDGVIITNTDVTALKRAEQYEHYRRRILELLAENEPLPAILKALVEGVEQMNPAMLCSILLLDQAGKHLGKSVAPSLPESYSAALEGVEIGLGVGSCGTAAFTGERVIVADIATHPYWAAYKALAASAGLGSCWSQPIRSPAGQVLGTFAIYHRDVHTPSESDIDIIEQAASLARIAIEKRLAAEQLQDNEARWKFALEGGGEGVWDWNIQTGVAFYSKRWKEMIGFAEDEIGNEASEWSSRVHPEDFPKVMAAIEAHIDGKTPSAKVEFRLLCKDGQWLWTLGRGMVVSRSSDGRALRLVGTNTDISERRQAEEALREQKDFFHLIAENIGDFIAVLDLEGRRLYNSPSYRKFFGNTDTAELRGTDSFAEIHPDDQARVKAVFRETVLTGIGSKIEYRFRVEDGSFRDIESLGSVIRDGEGRVARVVIVSHDITERKQMEAAVRQLAFYDELTKLPNRRLLDDRLSQTMAASARNACYGALMFLDLDNFKPLNDTHGHNVGDLLLIEVADRLRSCVREMDTVVRFGGDEFVVMISELDTDKAASIEQVALIAEKIRVTLSAPYLLTFRHEGGSEEIIRHHCTASIGIALFINHDASQDEILMRADSAMYQAKDAGRDLVRFYDEPA